MGEASLAMIFSPSSLRKTFCAGPRYHVLLKGCRKSSPLGKQPSTSVPAPLASDTAKYNQTHV